MIDFHLKSEIGETHVDDNSDIQIFHVVRTQDQYHDDSRSCRS